MGIGNRGYNSGVVWWDIELVSDEYLNEMTCFGVAKVPCKNSDYQNSSDLWMLRAYTGGFYCLGSEQARELIFSSKVHPGDRVRCILDW